MVDEPTSDHDHYTGVDVVSTPVPIKGFIQGSTHNGVLKAIRANGKVWNVKEVAAAALRKMMPVGTVLKTYFPLARRAEAAVAWLGNEKHNPGEELHWARGKSDDHLDCLGRHMSESEDWDVTVLPDGRAFAVLHAAQAAWRASALAQLKAEEYGGVVVVELVNPQLRETAQNARTVGVIFGSSDDPKKP